MIGWYLLGRSAGRRRERQRLEEQAERQRLRAPEPMFTRPSLSAEDDGDVDPRLIERFAFVILFPLALLVILLGISAWVFWIGVLVLGVVFAMLAVR